MQFFLGCIVISAGWVSFAEACTSEAFHVWDDPCRLIDNSSVLSSDFSIPRQARTFGGEVESVMFCKTFFFFLLCVFSAYHVDHAMLYNSKLAFWV